MDTLLRDLRFALRRLAARPGFTAVAILSLALGIGANTAIFTLLDEILFSRPPYRDVEALVEVYPVKDGRVELNAFSYPELEDLREGAGTVFSGIAARAFTLVQENQEGSTESLSAELVTGNWFDLLGFQPVAGRSFLPEEDRTRGTHPVVMLGHSFWQRRFGGDPGAVGREIRLNGRPFTIVGVAPPDVPGFLPGLRTDVYAPVMMTNEIQGINRADQLEERGSHNLFVKARLREGANLAAAQTALDAVVAGTHEEYPEYPDDWGLLAVPTADIAIHPLFDRVLFPAGAVLLAVVLAVLAIACANLASFLLAQAADRRKEIALRLALGAERGLLVRQLLTETVLLALAGGAAGVLLAVAGLQLLGGVELPLPVPVDLAVTPDAGVLGASLALALAAGLLFGLLPALQSARGDLVTTIKTETVAAGSGARRWSLRNVLVVAQVGVSLALLVTSGLFLRSLLSARSVDPGFGREPTAIAWLGLTPDRYDEAASVRFFQHLAERTEELPGVEAVGLVDNLALGGLSFNGRRIRVDGVAPPPGQEDHVVDAVTVDGGYFEAAGVPLVAGRPFGPEDTADGAPVVIVSEAMQERFWPGESAVGREVVDGDDVRLRVVGVARDTKVRTIGEEPTPYLYLPITQAPGAAFQVLARTSGDPAPVARRIVELARERDAEVLVLDSKTMTEHLSFMLVPFRLGSGLLSVLGCLALALATIGLYGVVSYSAASRTREMGIRLSLGARAGQVVGLVLGGGLRLVAVGLAGGLLLAFAASRLIGGLLFGVAPTDPATFAAVTGLLVVVGAAAALGPALRAARVDPVDTLKAD